MEIEHKLRQIGNSLVVTIPTQLVRDMKLKEGDIMLIDRRADTIMLKKQMK